MSPTHLGNVPSQNMANDIAMIDLAFETTTVLWFMNLFGVIGHAGRLDLNEYKMTV